MNQYRCLMCQSLITSSEVSAHKKTFHSDYPGYGMMWPSFIEELQPRRLAKIEIHESKTLAKALGVSKVMIRDEGQNLSGSMKDYSTERAVSLARQSGHEKVTVVSCGNHAFSLAKYASLEGMNAIVFTPASSSKIPLLSTIEGVTVVAVKDAIFEDVYRLAADLDLPGVYNANVSNEDLLFGFAPVVQDVLLANVQPDYILSGVGNGSYLAGIALAYQQVGIELPKIMPVGMDGAFPAMFAFFLGEMVYEHDDFLCHESLIDAAEGSIAIASYSMPQLIHAVKLSLGKPLGGLLNDDLATAYRYLFTDHDLVDQGAIPEPTGIMGLASAIRYKKLFKKTDCLLISFTGNGIKDMEGIRRLVPDLADRFEEKLCQSRPDLVLQSVGGKTGRVIYITKEISTEELKQVLEGGA